jgi:hypothetical protein
MVEANDFWPEHLACLDRWYALEIDTIDLLVHGMYCSFQDSDLQKQYWRCWIFMSLMQYYTQAVCHPLGESGPLGHYAGAFAGWRTQLRKMHESITAESQSTTQEKAALLKALMDDFPEPFASTETNWAIGSPEPCHPTFAQPTDAILWFQKLAAQEPSLAGHLPADGLNERRKRVLAESVRLRRRYRDSKARESAYHKAVDFIRTRQF